MPKGEVSSSQIGSRNRCKLFGGERFSGRNRRSPPLSKSAEGLGTGESRAAHPARRRVRRLPTPEPPGFDEDGHQACCRGGRTSQSREISAARNNLSDGTGTEPHRDRVIRMML